MPVELIVPSVGESITEVEIGDWLKTPGEPVNQDDPLVVLETDKVTVELPAPTSGTITSMLKRKGEKAAIGDVIGYMEPNGSASVGAVYDRPGAHRAPLQEQTEAKVPPEAAKAEPPPPPPPFHP